MALRRVKCHRNIMTAGRKCIVGTSFGHFGGLNIDFCANQLPIKEPY